MIRIVSSAWKTGDYGTTVWHHKMGCGHVVSQKRRLAEGRDLDCTQCDEDVRAQEQLDSMPDPEAPVTDSHAPETAPEVELDDHAAALEWAQMARAVIASTFRIDPEQIQIVAGDKGIEGGIIVLTPKDVNNLLNGLTRE
jgi:hypothetical protein